MDNLDFLTYWTPIIGALSVFVVILIQIIESLVKIRTVLPKQKTKKIGLKAFNNYLVSIAYPSFLSKKFSSKFLITIYVPKLRAKVSRTLKKEMGKGYQEDVSQATLPTGTLLTIRLVSPEIQFTNEVIVEVKTKTVITQFLGKPNEHCEPGTHNVLLTIIDKESEIEYFSKTFDVNIQDYAFDHVSRPLLSRVSAIVLGTGSFTMFILTFLEQIDKTIGLTSGTAAGVLAVGIYASFYNLYQRIRPNTQ